MWTGAKYGVTNELDVIGAYYHYIQNSYFGTANGSAPCSGSEHPQCAGTFDAISVAIDWRFAAKWDVYIGAMLSQVNGDWPTAFSSATTSIPRPDCASVSETFR